MEEGLRVEGPAFELVESDVAGKSTFFLAFLKNINEDTNKSGRSQNYTLK